MPPTTAEQTPSPTMRKKVRQAASSKTRHSHQSTTNRPLEMGLIFSSEASEVSVRSDASISGVDGTRQASTSDLATWDRPAVAPEYWSPVEAQQPESAITTFQPSTTSERVEDQSQNGSYTTSVGTGSTARKSSTRTQKSSRKQTKIRPIQSLVSSEGRSDCHSPTAGILEILGEVELKKRRGNEAVRKCRKNKKEEHKNLQKQLEDLINKEASHEAEMRGLKAYCQSLEERHRACRCSNATALPTSSTQYVQPSRDGQSVISGHLSFPDETASDIATVKPLDSSAWHSHHTEPPAIYPEAQYDDSSSTVPNKSGHQPDQETSDLYSAASYPAPSNWRPQSPEPDHRPQSASARDASSVGYTSSSNIPSIKVSMWEPDDVEKWLSTYETDAELFPNCFLPPSSRQTFS